MIYKTQTKEQVKGKVMLTSGGYVSISHLLPAIEILQSHAGMGLDEALLTIGCSRSESELIKSYFNKQS
ncbi:hypothetical protein CK911_01315 [Aeromonas sp. CU5]|uniref:hypothetical protein n=1 Tax=Aeromonas sp. CU5 TaxID=2033033 RepID=UPI000BFC4D32|nr:hypothetical protein [Aeromonas sp. CU5]ATL91577.1 hypothetical protein CK911_01315 [Aeromonas sp. CU5]